MERTKRETKFELLRILAMFGIVLSHFSTHGVWNSASFINRAALDCLSLLGPVSVDVFVILTGFFTIKKRFNAASLFTRVIAPTIFWIALIDVIALAIPSITPTLETMLSVPWFVVAYCALYLFVPWMNYLALTIQKRSYQLLLCTGFLLFSLASMASSKFFNSNLTWFCWLYLTGGYLRTYAPKYPSGSIAALLLLSLGLSFGPVIACRLAGKESLIIPNSLLTSRNSPTIVLFAITVFLLFRSLDFRNSKNINSLAGQSFGVYLVSDHPIVRNLLWSHFAFLASLPLHVFLGLGIVICFIVYLASSSVEFARQQAFKLLGKFCWKDSWLHLFEAINTAMNRVS